MSLRDDFTCKCVFINKIKRKSSYGGFVTDFVDGDEFEAQIPLLDSNAAKIAAAQGVKNIYTVTTTKDIVLQNDDVFRRIKDGKVFRVTSDGQDNATPPSAALNMRQVTAEEWKIPASTDN